MTLKIQIVDFWYNGLEEQSGNRECVDAYA